MHIFAAGGDLLEVRAEYRARGNDDDVAGQKAHTAVATVTI